LIRRVAALVALGAVLLQSAPVWAGLADRVGATFGLMTAEFVKAFQPTESVVVGMDGDAVYLDVGERAGAQVGQEFTIFRKGEPFYRQDKSSWQRLQLMRVFDSMPANSSNA